MNWTVGQFDIQVSVNGAKTAIPVAGWINGLFALDFRVFIDENDEYRKGWALTHLPTGYIVTKLAADRDEAFGIADEIAACADWHFDQTKPDATVSRAIKPIFDRLGSKNMRGYSDISPVWAPNP